MQWLYGAIKTTSRSILTQSNLTRTFPEGIQSTASYPGLSFSFWPDVFNKLIWLCKRDPPQGSLWVRRQAWICLSLQKENTDLSASKLVYYDSLPISVIENMMTKLSQS